MDETAKLLSKIVHLEGELDAEKRLSYAQNVAIQVAQKGWLDLAEASGETGLLPEDAVYQMLVQALALYANRVVEPNLFTPNPTASAENNG